MGQGPSAIRVEPVHAGTLRRVTSGLPFFAPWSARDFRAKENQARLVSCAAGAVVLERDGVDPFAYFLLDGAVDLDVGDGKPRRLLSDSVDAGFPIAHLRPSRYRVTAAAPVRLLRIERAALQRAARTRAAAHFRVDDDSSGGTWREHPLVDDFCAGLRAGRVQLPSMPAIALQVRRVVADEKSNLGDLATVISADPGISASLIKVANSAVFRGEVPCDSVKAAVTRLGVTRTQNLVTSLALRGVFVADQAYIRTRLKRVWQHSVEIAALSAVLARLTPGLSADVALIVGLLHEVGAIPLLRLAADYLDLEETPGLLDDVLQNLVPEISGTILAQWGFPDTFAEAALHARDWFHDGAERADHCDLVLVAHLHAHVRRREFEKLPRLDETPAFGKLALGRLSPQLSLLVLEESRSHIEELRALLA